MDTCFLFTKHLDDSGCFCLKISPTGELTGPPAQRSFAEIKIFQQECKTLIIETCENASILDLELPWLPERKARTAIPYALEDKLAQSLEELHFSFDKLRYQNNHYLITVIDKNRLRHIMRILDEQLIDFETITLDWFALTAETLCVSESILLVNNSDFKGALSGQLAHTYLKMHPQYQPLMFQDSEIMSDPDITKNPESSYVWLAQNLLKTKPLNLCQGDMQHGNTSNWVKKGYMLTGVLCSVWLLSLLVVNAISLHYLNNETDTIDKQISIIYHEFFPEAKQVISPRFRITQLLGDEQGDSQIRFWFLLNQFSKVMKDNKINIEQLRYQNKILSVTIVTTDFASLEEIENKLRKLQLKVNQTQAANQDQQVIATLELT